MNDNTPENTPSLWQNRSRTQIVPALLARFERQLAVGKLNSPLGDNCVQTLGKLADHAYDPEELKSEQEVENLLSMLQDVGDGRT